MTKKRWFYVIFFVVLFLGFYFALTRIIPGYAGDVKLPVLSTVKPFAFLDQDGKIITNRDVEGKVYVAEYFFTTCKGICPKMNQNMKLLYEEFKTDPDFRILSHSVDPETDSVPRMKIYADSLHADSKTWYFLTGRRDSLYHAARVSYLLDDPKNDKGNVEDQFIHTQFFAIVDKNGQVRKIYDGLKKDEINSLRDDIRLLLREKSSGVPASSALYSVPSNH